MEPHIDPTPTRILSGSDLPSTSPPSAPLTRDQLLDRLLNAVLGAVAAVLVSWLLPFTRPPATSVDPTAPTAIMAARGEKAAVVLEEVFGSVEPQQ